MTLIGWKILVGLVAGAILIACWSWREVARHRKATRERRLIAPRLHSLD